MLLVRHDRRIDGLYFHVVLPGLGQARLLQLANQEEVDLLRHASFPQQTLIFPGVGEAQGGRPLEVRRRPRRGQGEAVRAAESGQVIVRARQLVPRAAEMLLDKALVPGSLALDSRLELKAARFKDGLGQVVCPPRIRPDYADPDDVGVAYLDGDPFGEPLGVLRGGRISAPPQHFSLEPASGDRLLDQVGQRVTVCLRQQAPQFSQLRGGERAHGIDPVRNAARLDAEDEGALVLLRHDEDRRQGGGRHGGGEQGRDRPERFAQDPENLQQIKFVIIT